MFPFVDWLDLAVEPDTFCINPWPQGGHHWQHDLPVVGELLPDLRPGKVRRRKWMALGLHSQAFYWTPDDMVAFASLPGGWWSRTAADRCDPEGWATLRVFDKLPGYRTRVQRIDISIHVPWLDGVSVRDTCKATVAEFKVDGVVTGWTVGSTDSGWLVRAYRKDLHDPRDQCEVRFPGLRTLHPWRVEFQLRKDFLETREGGSHNGIDPAAWYGDTALAMMRHILDSKGITILTPEGPLKIPGEAGFWIPRPKKKSMLWHSLALQARGCYAQALLSELGMPDVPQASKTAVLNDFLPDWHFALDELESSLRQMIERHNERN